jgi:16S rRNA (cytidine1402-2'-O)-methyltransferase
MSGTLFVVATPIGNLEDITLRALRVLREVAIIAAEDTRRTGKLLAHYGISTPTISFHEHNARSRVPQLISRLRAGEHIAVVSDAGTPGVSDPGFELVQACIEAAIPVDPIPGASAAIAALMASGFPAAPASFRGFPPAKGNARKQWLLAVSKDPSTVILFESPHRVGALLDELAQFSGLRPITVARELTKMHQEILRGSAIAVKSQLKEARGEFTIVLAPIEIQRENVESAASPADIALEFGRLTENSGFGRREAITTLAKKHRRTTKEVYGFIESAKNSVD